MHSRTGFKVTQINPVSKNKAKQNKKVKDIEKGVCVCVCGMGGNSFELFYKICETTLISVSVDLTVLLNSKSTDF